MRRYMFFDMYSGGYPKIPPGPVYIDAASRGAAIAEFRARFGVDPEAVTFGDLDFSIYPVLEDHDEEDT